MIRAFVAGFITGGLLAAIFHRRILEFVDAKTRPARHRAAHTIGAAAEGLEAAKGAIERGFTGEHREDPRDA